jgi:hypothetical protein
MSTFAYRAALVREIEQSMLTIHRFPTGYDEEERGYQDGMLDAYAHILMLLKDEDL